MAFIAIGIATSLIGGVISSVFAPKPPDIEGPRLDDLTVPAVSPGTPMTRIWGTMAAAGKPIWTSGLKETEHEEKVKGGKGIGGKTQTVRSYTYSMDLAFAVCEGPVNRVKKIWANQKLLYADAGESTLTDEEALTAYAAILYESLSGEPYPGLGLLDEEDFTNHWVAQGLGNALAIAKARDAVGASLAEQRNFDSIEVFLGDETQEPSSIMESHLGVGNVPAYRGTCYFVLDELQLADYGNSMPTIKVEVEQADGTTLSIILGDLCRAAGLADDEFNALCEMPLVPVQGFALTRTASAREAINLLQQVYPFDGAEREYQIAFRWREKRIQALLRREDTSCRQWETGGELPPREEITRGQDQELPREINIGFQDYTRDYSANSARSYRTVTESNEVRNIDLPLALTMTEAKTAADDLMALEYTSRREYKMKFPMKYILLEPGDVVIIPETDGQSFRPMRVKQVNLGANWIVEVTFTDHLAKAPNISALGDDASRSIDELKTFGTTKAYLLDIPLLTNDVGSFEPGFYVALASEGIGWPGGALFKDLGSGGEVTAFGDTVEDDDEVVWQNVGTNNTAAISGQTLNALGAASEFAIDRVNTLLLQIDNPNPTLASISEDLMFKSTLNTWLIGNEIVRAATITDLGNGVFSLRNMLRGRLGTERFTGTHVLGERAIQLTNTALFRVLQTAAEINVEKDFRSATFDQDISEGTDIPFTNTGVSLKCYAPTVRGQREAGTDDVIINITPRVRQFGEWVDGVDAPLDQDQEDYDIEILDGPGGNVLNTYEVRNDDSFNYTAALQTTDLTAPQSAIWVRVYQIGKIIGRGFPTEVQI